MFFYRIHLAKQEKGNSLEVKHTPEDSAALKIIVLISLRNTEHSTLATESSQEFGNTGLLITSWVSQA